MLTKTLILLLAALASPAVAQDIVRHPNPAPAIFLNSVTVPPGAETLLVSGMLAGPIDPAVTQGMDAYGDTRTQTVSALGRIRAALAAQGYAMGDVVKLTAFVAGDPRLGGKLDLAGFNAGYRQFFGSADNPNLPVRSTVQVAGLVGPDYLIEIEVMAAKMPVKP